MSARPFDLVVVAQTNPKKEESVLDQNNAYSGYYKDLGSKDDDDEPSLAEEFEYYGT